MKKLLLFAAAFLVLSIGRSFAQTDVQVLPTVNVKALDGKTVSTGDFSNEGKPMIISFWATWCKPCILELVTVAEEYDNLVEETGVKLFAISIDDARNSSKVKPFVDGKAWDYEVYLDENNDFKRAMSVNNVPHTFVLNGKGEIVWSHNSYSPGDEEEMYEVVRKLAETGTIED